MTGDLTPIPIDDWTDLQRLRRRMYRIHDVRLPVPIAAVQAIAALVTLMLTASILSLFGRGLDSIQMIVPYFGPAVIAVRLSGSDGIGGRSIAQWLGGRARYLVTAKVMVIR